MPLGIVVAHQPGRHEAVANGDHGAARGREIEIAGLLQHAEAARRSQRRLGHRPMFTTAPRTTTIPSARASKDFDPFWEFVAGPAHAGTFAPGVLDGTFGPEVRFNGTPADLKPNRPPDPDTQFFGMLEADPASRALTVSLINTAGTRVFEQRLEARRRNIEM